MLIDSFGLVGATPFIGGVIYLQQNNFDGFMVVFSNGGLSVPEVFYCTIYIKNIPYMFAFGEIAHNMKVNVVWIMRGWFASLVMIDYLCFVSYY